MTWHLFFVCSDVFLVIYYGKGLQNRERVYHEISGFFCTILSLLEQLERI